MMRLSSPLDPVLPGICRRSGNRWSTVAPYRYACHLGESWASSAGPSKPAILERSRPPIVAARGGCLRLAVRPSRQCSFSAVDGEPDIVARPQSGNVLFCRSLDSIELVCA
jgi:hypothetical protein